jgi:RHS repeat-associated protein
MLGRTVYSVYCDAGARWSVTNAVGNPLRVWDSRDHVICSKYDVLQRRTELRVQTGADPEVLAEQTIYGETLLTPEVTNHRGKVYQVKDGADVGTSVEYDFKGNLLEAHRQLAVAIYQCSNHLGPAMLELDKFGAVISYEEYHPYGTSAYRATNGSVEVSARRYRYTGKERDEETGLYYHGARYYACWLARWTAADPVGMVDGVNLYRAMRNNPIKFIDPSGNDPALPNDTRTVDERNESYSAVCNRPLKIPRVCLSPKSPTHVGGRHVGTYADDSPNRALSFPDLLPITVAQRPSLPPSTSSNMAGISDDHHNIPPRPGSTTLR